MGCGNCVCVCVCVFLWCVGLKGWWHFNLLNLHEKIFVLRLFSFCTLSLFSFFVVWLAALVHKVGSGLSVAMETALSSDCNHACGPHLWQLWYSLHIKINKYTDWEREVWVGGCRCVCVFVCMSAVMELVYVQV